MQFRFALHLFTNATRFGRCLGFVCLTVIFFGAPLRAQSAPFSRSDLRQLDQLVDDLCQKQVVFLSEDNNHGAGRTFEVKTKLLENLIDRCGFSAVFFESSIYDFVDLEQRVAQRKVTREQIADALGSLWSTTAQGDVLVAALHRRVQNKGLRLLGMDLQAGSASSFYQKTRFGAELTAELSKKTQADCAARILRHMTWGYDDKANPYDDQAIAHLTMCASDIRQSFASKADKTWQVLARSFAEYLRMSTLAPAEQTRLRDYMMNENFRWHRARLPEGSKVIVWTAAVHSIKQRSSANVQSIVQPLGFYVHQALGDRSAVVGFCALQGRYSLINRAETALISVLPESLEAQAFAGYDASIRYLDAKHLRKFGAVQANALSYAKANTEDWSTLMDAMIVLREEHPVNVVHSRLPQQSK